MLLPPPVWESWIRYCKWDLGKFNLLLTASSAKDQSTRIHSSWMRTARSLTVSRSILAGGSADPLNADSPWIMQTPPGCRPPQCRPLNGDPLDEDTPPPDVDRPPSR